MPSPSSYPASQDFGYTECSYLLCLSVFLDSELVGTWLFLFYLGTLIALKNILQVVSNTVA